MIWILCLFTIFVTGCQQKPQERHYTEITIDAPQAQQPVAPAAEPMASDPHAGMDMSAVSLPGNAPANNNFSWVVPEGWKEVPSKGMRLASFQLVSDEKAIDSSIVFLPGVAGGLEANLTRWMGQIGVTASPEEINQLISSASSIKVGEDLTGKVFDFTTIMPQAKPSDKSMIVVLISIKDSSLFVKMIGTIDAVKQNKDAFLRLAQSIKQKAQSENVAPASSDQGMNMSDFASAHAGLNMADPHAGLDMNSLPSQMGGENTSFLDWDLPAGWKAEAGRSMRLATFSLASDSKAFDCSIISLGGAAGGLEANLSRWIGQIGLEPSKENLDKLTSSSIVLKTKDGMGSKVFNLNTIKDGAKPDDKSMLVAMIAMDNATIFIKMIATVESINQHKDGFEALIKSLRHK